MMKRIAHYSMLTAMFLLFTGNLLAQENHLSEKQKKIITISALTAKGDLIHLKTELHQGLDAGLTVNQIKESLVHLYAYCGFPRSIRGLQTFMEVLEERRADGIMDELGAEASPITDSRDKYERGKEILATLTLTPPPETLTGYSAFAPVMDTFLKEHLFADIFERDVLTFSERELVTVSVISAIGHAEPMLRSHLNICLNVGLTPTQLNQFVDIIHSTIGEKEGASARAVLEGVLQNTSSSTSATPPSALNFFSLVYDGAITENVPGKVQIQRVTYLINDIPIVANIYTPPHYNPSKTYPAIVVAHPNGGVKEQVSGLYAQRLAEQGYITIVADAAYQGGSGGEPRNVDKPSNRIEDIHSMADFISQYPGVDGERIGLLGICGGGGYAIKSAQSDKRFKAVATLSMFNSGVVRRNGFMNSQTSTIQERLKQATEARAQEVTSGNVTYVGEGIPTDEEIAQIPTDLYREGYVYYYRTHAHPNSTFRYTMSSLLQLMTWDASTNMDLLTQPLLMIAGSNADTLYMTEDVFGKATNATNKELFLLDGATHIQTYWKQEHVGSALNKLTTFYQSNL